MQQTNATIKQTMQSKFSSENVTINSGLRLNNLECFAFNFCYQNFNLITNISCFSFDFQDLLFFHQQNTEIWLVLCLVCSAANNVIQH